jgi:hypothetical protein
MAKRGLMDKVKQAVVKAGTPVARTLAKGTVAAVNTVDALSEKLPSNKKKAVRSATSVVKSAAESTMRATKPGAAARPAPAPDEGVAPPPSEARRVTAKKSAGPRTVSSASEATAAPASREMGAAPPPSEATRVTAAERARAAATAATATREAGRKTMPAAAAKRATKSASKAPAKKQGFKAKRGQKHNHHR